MAHGHATSRGLSSAKDRWQPKTRTFLPQRTAWPKPYFTEAVTRLNAARVRARTYFGPSLAAYSASDEDDLRQLGNLESECHTRTKARTTQLTTTTCRRRGP